MVMQFIQSLQIIPGREERCSSLPWVCFSFFSRFFSSTKFFLPTEDRPPQKKFSVGKWLTGGTNLSMWNKSRFGRRRRVPWDKNGIPSDVRSRSDMGRVDVQKMSKLSALILKF